MTTLLLVETRKTFAGLESWEKAIWYALIVVSVLLFLWGVGLLVRKYRKGRGGRKIDEPGRRAARATRIILFHTWIRRRDPVAGFGHLLIFYGFVVLFIGTMILSFQDNFARPVLGFDFWHGWFYLVYSLFLDVFGVALIVGLTVMAVNRGINRPSRLDYSRPDREPDEYSRRRYVLGDWTFLGILFFLALTGFLLESFRIAADNPSFEKWAPFGWLLGQAFRELGLGGNAAENAHLVQWWIHGVVALFFVSSIPFTKAVHMLTGPAGVAMKDEGAGRQLGEIPADATDSDIGYATIDALSSKHLINLDACTKCGKCHDACPATATGYPLSPRDLVLDLREVADGSMGIRAEMRVPPLFDESRSILGDPIRPETLWSCMQCMACVEICPVGIEHVPMINEMRRQLVERGEMDNQLQQVLETIHTSGNSFGETKRKRSRWSKTLDTPIKDIRKDGAEYLWFVGDYASFDPRNQVATQDLARILQSAGVDFGILFESEKTAGNDVRRVGEEGLWTSLAEDNMKEIGKCSFGSILTSDPHSFNTLKNEYPPLGAPWTADQVVHHSELFADLLETGGLIPRRRLGHRVTYHDPCALGRYNGVYDPPRAVLEALGLDVVEMPRNRDNSFCCGAGGGRIWMKELAPEGSKRPSESRIDEAVALGDIDFFVVACPKDVTMYEDAIKTSGHQGAIALREISELVLEATAESSEDENPNIVAAEI